MAIYLVILALIAVLALAMPASSKSNKRTYVIICFAVLTLVASIRSYTVGIDTRQFYDAYAAIGLTPWSSLDGFRYEWGFTILCKLLNYVSPNPQLLLLASSCIINIPIGIFIHRNSENVGLSTFLYVALCFYTSNMNIMREAMAVSIVLIAFETLKKKHNVAFIILVLLAASFHKTAIACLVLLPLWHARFTRRALFIYIALALALFVFSGQVSQVTAMLFGRDDLYGAEYMGSNYFGALIKALFAALLVLITFNYYHVGYKRDGRLSQTDNFYCHMLALWIVFLVLGMRVEIFGRLCMYFQIFAPIAMADALRFTDTSRERLVLILIIGGVALLYFVTIGIFRPEWDGAIPYVVAPSITAFIS